MSFAAGQRILVREVLHGAEWASWEETVLADDEVLASVKQDGTSMTFPPHPVPHPWGHLAAWQGTTVLKLRRPGDWYAVWKFFDSSGFLCWYVNFETPYVRRDGGIDVNDLQLDIVIPAEGEWRWKDVQDLAPTLASGRISHEELLAVLAAATDVAGLLDRDERWWSGWDGWEPVDLLDG